jgi:hypothetical protein
MRVTHDLICENDHEVHGVIVDTSLASGTNTTYGVCPECGTPYVACYYHGKPPATDVLGCERYSPVLDESFTSDRELVRKMRAKGMEHAEPVRGGPMSQSNHLPAKLTPAGYEGRARFGGDA